MIFLHIEIAKDPVKWNSIVERIPFSSLHHRYEVCVQADRATPFLIKDGNNHFLFPLRILNLFNGFKLATSQIYYYVSILPDIEENVNSMQEALDCIVNFLRKMGVVYFSTCAPTFLSKRYTALLNTSFRKYKASVQVLYLHLMSIKNATFEEIWNKRFKKNARYSVRKAKNEGVNVIKIDDFDDIYKWINDIYQCNLSALKRQGREGAYPDSYKEVFLSELISTKKILGQYFNIYGAIYQERLIAYMIVREYNMMMQVNKAMSHTKFLDKCPNDALIAYLVKEACDRGVDWFEYAFERVKRGGKIPMLHPTLLLFKSKFGFEEVPMFIYRLGLTPIGRMIKALYSGREYIIARSAYIPESIREVLLRFYAQRRRRFSVFADH